MTIIITIFDTCKLFRSGLGDFSTGLENVEPIEMNLHTIRLNMITFVKITRNYWSGVGLPAF